jgi:hypothetical protein
MSNQASRVIEARVPAFAIAHPCLGPRRIGATLAQESWGGIATGLTAVRPLPLDQPAGAHSRQCGARGAMAATRA